MTLPKKTASGLSRMAGEAAFLFRQILSRESPTTAQPPARDLSEFKAGVLAHRHQESREGR